MAEFLEERLTVSVSEGDMAGIKWSPMEHSDQAPALIFLHANGFCASTYRGLLSSLCVETRRTIIGLDLRGHGRSRISDNPDEQDNWNRHAKDICEAAAQLAPQGVVLAGHSMGGTSALLASARAPHLVKGLCLFDPVLAPSGFYLYAKMPWVFGTWRKHFPMAKNAARRRAVFASREAAVAAYTGRGAFKSWPVQTITDYCEDGFTDLPDGSVTLSCAPAFEAACFAGQRHDPYAALKKLKVPARLLRAAKGSTTIPLVVPKLERFGVQVETVDGTSHFLPIERPDVALAAMAEMIGR